MFARFKRGDRHRRMHVRRCADPDNVDVRQRHQLRPIFIGVAPGTFSLQNFSELSYAELETATISTSGCFLRPGKWRVRTMLPAPTIPIRSFWLFLCIGLRAIAILQTRLAVVRAKFDREEQWRVQRQNIGRGGSPEPPMAIEVNLPNG